MHGLLDPLDATLTPLVESLCPANGAYLVHTLAANLAEQLEASVLRKRFNEAGAMLLQVPLVTSPEPAY